MLNKYPDIFWLIFDKCFKFAHIIASTTAHATAMCLQNDKLDSNGVNVHYGTKKNLAPEPYPFDCRAGPPKNLPLCMSVVCQKLRNYNYNYNTNACPVQDFSLGQVRRAEGRERGWVSWRVATLSSPARSLGSTVSSSGGVRGRAPTTQRFFTIFCTQDGLSWHCNIVNYGLSCSHWGQRPQCPLAYAPVNNNNNNYYY